MPAGRPIASSAAHSAPSRASPASSSEFGERLPPMGEGALDEPLESAVFGPPFGPLERDQRRVHVRRRPEDVRETGWKPVARRSAGRVRRRRRSAFVRGSAKKRSATSRCTITHQRSTSGSPSRARRRSAWRRCTAGSRRAWSAAGRARRGRAPARRPKQIDVLAPGEASRDGARAPDRARPRGRGRPARPGSASARRDPGRSRARRRRRRAPPAGR